MKAHKYLVFDREPEEVALWLDNFSTGLAMYDLFSPGKTAAVLSGLGWGLFDAGLFN